MHHTILRFLTDNTGPSKNVNVVWLEAEAISPRVNEWCGGTGTQMLLMGVNICEGQFGHKSKTLK